MLKTQMTVLFWLFSLLLAVYSAPGDTLTLSVTSAELNKNPIPYTFTLRSTSFTNMPAGSTIQISFPADYLSILPTSPLCQTTGSTVRNLTCSVASTVITITNYFTSDIFDSIFTVAIANIRNPPKTGFTDLFAALIINPSSSVVFAASGTTLRITPSNAACSITSSSQVLGFSNAVTFTINITNPIPISGGFNITVPKWDQTQKSMITNPTGVTCQVILPNLLTPTSCSVTVGSVNDTIIVRGISPVVLPASTMVTFYFANIRNPPLPDRYTFEILTIDDAGRALDTCSPTLQVSTPNIITFDSTNFFVCLANTNIKTINSAETCVFTFTTTNPLPAGSQIRITFPSEVGTSRLQTLSQDTPTSISSLSALFTFPSITITNAVSSYASELTTFQIRMNVITHPNTTAPTSSFTITTLRGSDPIDTVSTGMTYAATAGALVSTAVSANPSRAGSSSSLTFTLVVSNPLTTQGIVTIIFPSEFTVPDGTSTCAGLTTNTRSTATCVTSSRSLTVSNLLRSSIARSETISFRVDSITLPSTTKPTATPFQISTGNGVYFVDILNTLFFTATTGVITAAANLQAISNPFVGKVSSYELSINCQNPVPVSAVFYITLPSDNQITISDINALTQGARLTYSLIPYNNLILTIDTTSQPSIIAFTNPLTSSSIPANSLIQILLPGLTTPLTTGGTASFLVETRTFDGFSIDRLSTGLGLVSGTISPSDFSSATVTPGVSTTGSATTYTFRITPALRHSTTDLLLVTFPSMYQLPSNLICQITTPSVGSTIGCPADLTNTISIQLNMNVSALSQITLVVQTVTNPVEAMTIDTFIVATRTASGFSVHRRSSGISLTTSSASISTGNLTRDTLALNASAVYTFTFTPANTYPSNVTIEVKVPAQVTIPSSFVCRGVIGYTQNPSVCRIKPSTTDIIQIIGGGPYSRTSIGFSINSLVNPSVNINSDPFSIIVYSQNGLIIDQLPASTSNNLVAITPCDSSCANCLSTSRFACTACYSPYKLYQSQFTCITGCPSNTYENNGVCLLCDSSCLRCSGPGSRNCTACNTASLVPYLNDGTCVAQCPANSYLDNSKTCVECTPPCAQCTSATACSACVNNFYLSGTQCVGDCPAGFFNDPSLQCKKCKTGCLTCSSLSNCTTCDQSSAFPVFSNWDCISGCPTGTYRSGSNCLDCEYPCATCSFGPKICDTCQAGLFLSLGSCVACQSPCASCAGSPTTCSSCISEFFLQESQCVRSCSDGYYADNSTKSCIKCTGVCDTCTSPTNCLSCDQTSLFPYFYSNSCTAICPMEAPDIQLGKCVDLNLTRFYNPYTGIYISGVPFPYLIFSTVGVLLAIISKGIHHETHVIGVCSSLLGITETSSWITLIVVGAYTHPDDLSSAFYVFIAILGVVFKLLNNALYYKFSIKQVLRDEDFLDWKNDHRHNKVATAIITAFSFYDFRVFRMLHTHFMGFKFFNADFERTGYHRKITIFTILHLLVTALLLVIAAISGLNKDAQYPQIRNIGIEIVILTLAEELLSILFALKPELAPKILPIDPAITAITAIEKSILEKLGEKIHESMNTTRQNDSTRNRTFRRRNSQPISDYEYHISEDRLGQDSSSFIGLNTSLAATKLLNASNDDIYVPVGKGGFNGEEMSRVDAIEEKDKEDDDVEPNFSRSNDRIETNERMETNDEFLITNMDNAHKRLENLEKRLNRLSERKTSYDSPFKPSAMMNSIVVPTFSVTNGNIEEPEPIEPIESTEPQAAIENSSHNGQAIPPLVKNEILISEGVVPNLKGVDMNIRTSQPTLQEDTERKIPAMEETSIQIAKEEMNTLHHTNSSLSRDFYNTKSESSRSQRFSKMSIVRPGKDDEEINFSSNTIEPHFGSSGVHNTSPINKVAHIISTQKSPYKKQESPSIEPKEDAEPERIQEFNQTRFKSPPQKISLRKVINDIKLKSPQTYNTEMTQLRRSTNPVTETYSNSKQDESIQTMSLSPRQRSAGKNRSKDDEFAASFNGEEIFTKKNIGKEVEDNKISIIDYQGDEKTVNRSILKPRELLKDGRMKKIVHKTEPDESEEEIVLRDKRPGSKVGKKSKKMLSNHKAQKEIKVDGSIESLEAVNDPVVNFNDETPSNYNEINQRFLEGFKKKERRPKRESKSTIKKVGNSAKKPEGSKRALRPGISKNNFLTEDDNGSVEPNGEIAIIPGKESISIESKTHFNFHQKVKDLTYLNRYKEKSHSQEPPFRDSSPEQGSSSKKREINFSSSKKKDNGYGTVIDNGKEKKTFDSMDSERFGTSNIQVIPSDSIDISQHTKKFQDKYKLPDKNLRLQSIGKSFDASSNTDRFNTMMSSKEDGHPIFERNPDFSTIEKLNLDTQENDPEATGNYLYHKANPNGHF